MILNNLKIKIIYYIIFIIFFQKSPNELIYVYKHICIYSIYYLQRISIQFQKKAVYLKYIFIFYKYFIIFIKNYIIKFSQFTHKFNYRWINEFYLTYSCQFRSNPWLNNSYRPDLLSLVTDIQSLTIPPSSIRQCC